MKRIIPIYCLLLIVVLWYPFYGTAQIAYQDDVLHIQNTHMHKEIFVRDKGISPVLVQAWHDTSGRNVLSETGNGPLFECVIDDQLITANDQLWRYRQHSIRKMGNGGTEVVLVIEGMKAPVHGLQIHLVQQIFPGSTLMRERLELKAEEGKAFRLGKNAGRLHFRFPQYSMPSVAAASTEIRLASWASEIIDIDAAASFDERFPGGRFSDHNLAMNHMYHPGIIERIVENGTRVSVKGPINVCNTGSIQWITAYEHASQDDLRGLYRQDALQEGGVIRDAAQGTKGVFNFAVSEEDFKFLGIVQQHRDGQTTIGVEALRGAYLDGELITASRPYSTVWTATAFSSDTSAQKRREIVHEYLWRFICEKPASRQPEFYYNTWGMQRRLSSQGYDLRGVLTEKKIIEEIRRAADLGIDIFVLDDGWEQAQGDWTPHSERLPEGLAPIKAELDRHGIKMGIWLSPMGIDSAVERYREHPEWVIRDSEGNPILAQWNHPAFDFVSGFYDVFIEDCKRLIDAGARFFKWDAINTFYSALPNLHHGSDQYSDEEIRARYEYLLPIYVTKAMQELTDYEPDLVIEIDLTEARRVMNGLAPLSQGKVFWMNNGASGYNDYSSYRAKSMRTIPNRFAGIIPLELFTYANYPHSSQKSMRYNVNTSLVAGHGFWGALEETTEEERKMIGLTVEKSKRVLPYIADIITVVTGRVGASPEIYTMVNRDAGAGQIVAFSGSAMSYRHCVAVHQEHILGVLNHAYRLEGDSLVLDFQFPMPDATREAFIIPNTGRGISITQSTSWLDELKVQENGMMYTSGAAGRQSIIWDKTLGKPVWDHNTDVEVTVSENAESYILEVYVAGPGVGVHIAFP
jgi:hypothetical protein